MNFHLFLLEFLKKPGSVSLPGFGTFYLHTINAVLDKEGKNILPPGAEVAFKTDVSGNGNDFANFLSTQKNIPLIDAEIEIKKQINYWNATLHKEKKVSVENLGTFFLEDSKMIFSGNRAENLSADFYGLEEINISEIKNSPNKSGNSYQLSKSFYWITPMIIGILGLTYFGVTQPEMIFGQKSFKNETPKKEVTPIKIDSVKIDSLNAIQLAMDSIKNDSLQKAIAPIKAPVKKWSSKKYSKTQWKKPRTH
ncbi:hypothetical protein Q73A0000_13500 [Kaistella flava (ex Peng et al. 2021)]|uniref:CCDC81-like prokaryotic HU domain-containing protein n=1 Tax=Kaistella flava (ex Peng et al. 2021) TaxID=2038776 RepID=A0A7M2YCW4_9FLAO|nr:hypothetical protein [Kaistella flava (ex Peng et al. 2021)]QOW11302.1 hypothetical protein Q73A0000_13500 [Kaistella flava (ex Peng et al. 2021)]